MIKGILLAIAAILLVFWIVGLVAHILGAFIHVALVVAIVLVIGSFVMGRETA
jgi:hypothetical protein